MRKWLLSSRAVGGKQRVLFKSFAHAYKNVELNHRLTLHNITQCGGENFSFLLFSFPFSLAFRVLRSHSKNHKKPQLERAALLQGYILFSLVLFHSSLDQLFYEWHGNFLGQRKANS